MTNAMLKSVLVKLSVLFCTSCLWYRKRYRAKIIPTRNQCCDSTDKSILLPSLAKAADAIKTTLIFGRKVSKSAHYRFSSKSSLFSVLFSFL